MRKLNLLRKITHIGRFTVEGLGKIKWLEWWFEEAKPLEQKPLFKLKIRKGLPSDLHPWFEDLLKYGALGLLLIALTHICAANFSKIPVWAWCCLNRPS